MNFSLIYYKADRDKIVSLMHQEKYQSIRVILRKYGVVCSSCGSSDRELKAQIETAINENIL